MTHRNIKIGATTIVLLLAFSGLLWSTLREGTEYYKHVDEVMTNQQAWEGKRLPINCLFKGVCLMLRKTIYGLAALLLLTAGAAAAQPTTVPVSPVAGNPTALKTSENGGTFRMPPAAEHSSPGSPTTSEFA